MSIKQYFFLALKSLSASKMRSFLTMLGIIIGVAAVILLVSLVGGMTKSITDEMEGMGTNLVNVTIMGRGGNRGVDPADMEDLVETYPDLIAAESPQVSGSATAKIGNESFSTSITGVSDTYNQISNIDIEYGMFLQYLNVTYRQKVCVVGSYFSNNYYGGGQAALGQTIKLNGTDYTIIGVLAEVADSEEGSSDEKIYIPYTSAMQLMHTGKVSSYAFSATSAENSNAAMEVIEARLNDVYSSDDNAFMVMNQAEMISTMEEMTSKMSLVVAGVAGISLLVGGIGIMNIMLVSVTERTREIGIRKSLGARRREIMGQFVIEAATTSALGGLIGIIFGIAASALVSTLMDMDTYVSLTSIVLASGVSIAIGVIFGYFPAKKAAALNPIDALRYD